MVDKTKLKRVSEVYKSEPFYPELDKVEKEAIMGQDMIIQDARMMRDWHSEFGTSDFCLLKLEDLETGKQVTTSVGGVAVVSVVDRLIKERRLPIIGKIILEKAYYEIV